MILMKISNDIELNKSELPQELFRTIVKDLTIKNPAYGIALKLNRPLYNISEEISLHRLHGEKLILPRGYGKKLLLRFKEANIAYEVEDTRLTLPRVEFGSIIELRDYQAPAVNALVKNKQGGVVAPCGAGKTQIMLEAMSRIKQPTLWICHTYELLQQTLERAYQVLDLRPEDVGIIANGDVVVGKKFTIALIQTLCRADLTKLTDKFGAVFTDEHHHFAAKSFYYPLGEFPALYRLWCSATPERADGLTEIVYAAGGPILHSIEQCEVPTITPGLQVVETGFQESVEEYPRLISLLTKNNLRNGLIVKTIAAEAPGNYSLVLSDRVEHLEVLQKMLKAALPNMVIEILTGSMSKKARTEIMNRVKNREVDILLATQLAREGLDITHLNRLFLTTPKRASGAVQQEVGRVMRPCEGKSDAVVFDFWDNKTPILKAQFWKRREVYKKIGMQFNAGNVRRHASS